MKNSIYHFCITIALIAGVSLHKVDTKTTEINMFGTDGIRNSVGNYPFSIEALPQLGHAIAVWAQQKYGDNPKILLCHDTRISCSFVKAALKSGLLLHPVTIYDANVLPTPTACQVTQQGGLFHCGIIISASHNPYQDNGIKIIDSTRGKLSDEDEKTISVLCITSTLKSVDYSTLGTEQCWSQAEQQYTNTITCFFKPHFLQGKTVVLDCANGATFQLAQYIFEQFGATVIVINNQPNGRNINDQCGALHLQGLQQAVHRYHADAGFAFDGDGDRCIAVNKHGNIKDGDDILALLLEHPHYQQTLAVVGTIMTNQGLEQHIKNKGKKLLRTAVGDKYVAERLEQEELVIGGEQSGHIIIRDYLNTGDGIFTALRVLESMIYNNNWNMHTFTKYPQVLINVPIGVKKDLTQEPLASYIATSREQLHAGRLIVRYSGTEYVVRIMIEDDDYNHANTIGNQLAKQLQQELSSL